MHCPFCGNIETQVKDSRVAEDGNSIKRRRYCLNCDCRFTTFERVQLREIIVIKKDKSRTLFSANKLKKSIEMAVRKRPVSAEQIELIANGICRNLELGPETEITSATIGEIAMKELQKLDKVAFVRFASVYKNFETAADFQKFIKNIAED
jgi:transcriptional repressor NrdR